MRKLCLLWLCVEKLSFYVKLAYALAKVHRESSNLYKHPNRAIMRVEAPLFLREDNFFTAKETLIDGNLFNGCDVFIITGAPRL